MSLLKIDDFDLFVPVRSDKKGVGRSICGVKAKVEQFASVRSFFLQGGWESWFHRQILSGLAADRVLQNILEFIVQL